jgi:hypothetical protein
MNSKRSFLVFIKEKSEVGAEWKKGEKRWRREPAHADDGFLLLFAACPPRGASTRVQAATVISLLTFDRTAEQHIFCLSLVSGLWPRTLRSPSHPATHVRAPGPEMFYDFYYCLAMNII